MGGLRRHRHYPAVILASPASEPLTCVFIKTWIGHFEDGTYNFFFLSWWVPEEEAKRSEQDVHNSDDGHDPGEADSLSDGASDGRT